MSFVHLHVHSEYSLLDGFSNIKKLIQRAKELEMPALALTDHGTMFGVIDFYNAAKAAEIKPIVGVEAYLAPRGMSSRDPQVDKKSTHLLLLAENQTGYTNLLKLASAAQLNGFYYYPRVDHELLAQHSEGLICTSGCMSAEIPRLIQQENMDAARRQLDWYYEVFGAERFYLELQQHDIPELAQINKMLLDLGRRYDARFVATNDVHYVNKDDARLQDILLAIQTGCLLSDPNRMRMTDNSYYLRTPDEMARLFAEVPEAVHNTLLIAERCNIDLGFKGYHLPNFEVPEGYTAESYLRELCETGLQHRFGARVSDPVVRQRLDYELGIIHTMGFDTYFLIVWDLCRHAREVGIWYNARGSAAGSIVAYSLDITMVDPLEHGLIFERFLNPGRISMPDIDLDFRDDRRAEMLEYTARKYGDDKVAQIITFGTLGARAAIRDVGRVMDIPLSEVDKVAKLIPNIPGKPVTIEQALDEVTEFKQIYKETPYLRELIDTAKHMEGVVRNAGTHAAGVIITDKPVIEYIPLHRPTGNTGDDSPVKTVTQFEMSTVESLGLLKVDFLGLDTLTIMARACDLICQRYGVEFNLNNIPTDDPATYELMGRGETAGVFQVEGCLSGDTYIGHRTIKELYQDYTARQAAGIVSRRHLLRTASCYMDEGRFNLNEIVKAVYSGVKPVYRLISCTNQWIKATADHHFLTQRGWVRLGEIDIEKDRILIKTNYGRRPKETKTYSKAGYREDLGQYFRSSWEADLARVFRYLQVDYQYEPRTFELVAPDGRFLTYTPDFYLPGIQTYFEVKGWMDDESSQKIALLREQYPECPLVVVDRTLFAEFQIQYANLVAWECPQYPSETEWVGIRSIEFVGEEETYDLQMLPPGNNFVANGFIVHNSGMRRYLMQMKPKELANVIAMVALFRPGPMDFIPSYINRMHGKEPITYRHPALEQVLKETYGITVYQEQIMYTAMNLAGYTASEADNLRKGVAKKKADVLLKHRKTFVKGATARGIPEGIANQIFDDWEAFARYGFPKGHAADYGVIAVQTAYLKVHYPVEYMTAVLSARKNDTTKVALYVADCRRMGVAVEPPDINASEWDFAIEDPPDQKPVIRFGLGAVKNVGQAPVEAILKARESEPFTDLNDFARRVDLRHVGKRALESLVKVGALDRFGSRTALLEALDRVISVSTSHFRAAEVGQMSMFGAHTGLVEAIHLPKASVEISRREILNWERELIGLYVSDHPLSPVMEELTQAVTHFSGQLSEAAPNERVRVAGLITRIRHHQSKAGKPMGFVGLEDLQGTIELVIFPRTWEKVSELIEHDKIVLVEGRVDAEGAEPKVLVDTVTTEFKMTTPAEPPLSYSPSGRDPEPFSETLRPDWSPPEEARTYRPGGAGGKRQVAEATVPATPDQTWDDEIPPPPDAFPMDWDLPDIGPVVAPGVMEKRGPQAPSVPTTGVQGPDSEQEPAPAQKPAGAGAQVFDEREPDGLEADDQESGAHESVATVPTVYEVVEPLGVLAEPGEDAAEPSEGTEPSPSPILTPPAQPVLAPVLVEPASEVVPAAEKTLTIPPYLVPPATIQGDGTVHMITVVLRSTGDKTRDVLRLRRIHGIITSYPGNDRFGFHVFERGRGYLLEFPNFTAGFCQEMLSRLTGLVGPDHVRVEPITFQ